MDPGIVVFSLFSFLFIVRMEWQLLSSLLAELKIGILVCSFLLMTSASDIV